MERDEQTPQPERAPATRVPGTTYHGGFSFLSEPTRQGVLNLDDDAITMAKIVHETFTRNTDPDVELCRTRAVAAIEVTSEQVAKSRVGAAALFGVLGGVTAKATMDRVTMIVHLKSGEIGYLTIDGQPLAAVLAKLTPWMRGHGISSTAAGRAAPVDAETVEAADSWAAALDEPAEPSAD